MDCQHDIEWRWESLLCIRESICNERILDLYKRSYLEGQNGNIDLNQKICRKLPLECLEKLGMYLTRWATFKAVVFRTVKLGMGLVSQR